MPAFSDIELDPGTIAQAASGDAHARERLYLALERDVLRLARRIVPRGQFAEDLAQEVFVAIFEHLGQFDGRGPFAGWVRRIVVNRCLMHLRSPWQRTRRWLRELNEEPDTWEAPSAPVDAKEDRLDLERALGSLSETARLVVLLHDVEGYTHAEIGSALGGTASLSKSQLARAHSRLRELLEPDGGETGCMPVSTNC